MADVTNTNKTRLCANCGEPYTLNAKYSASQKAKSRFCSRSCAARSMPHDREVMSDLLRGQTRFGKLTFIGEAAQKGAMRRGLFRCDCGVEKPMGLHHIKHGRTFSCGCEAGRRAKSRFTTHGAHRSFTYRSWNAMMQRCNNAASTSYDQYGGRGIKVCEEWHGAEGYHRFLAYLGERPARHTLDRIDNDKGYEPGNVRWATVKDQQNNRRVSKPLTFNGETMNARDWAHRLGMSKNTIYMRLKAGWSVERALSEPAHLIGGRVARLTAVTAPV